MDYSQAIAYIESLSPVSLKPAAGADSLASTPSLERMKLFLKEDGDPQNAYPVVHIAGTNGKGSVTAMVDSVLTAAGARTGRYIGPHLLRWNERYHVNGVAITDSELARYAGIVRSQSESFGVRHPEFGELTWFEFLTALGCAYFAEQNVDYAVIEVGLGGLWDATNAVKSPLVTCIVTVGMDHMHILGPTIEAIATEKAGIIKRGIPVVTAATGAALEIIRKKAKQCGAPLIVCSFPDQSQYSLEISNDADTAYIRLPILCRRFITPELLACLKGGYQMQNAVVACVVLAVCQMRQNNKIDLSQHVQSGFSQLFWPGRFQYLPGHGVLLDGAHNLPGAAALRALLDLSFPDKRAFVLSAYQNKDVPEMLASLLRSGDRVYAGETSGRRPVFSAGDIAKCADELGCEARAYDTVRSAFEAALANKRSNETIVCTGSFVTVKEALLSLGCTRVEDSRPLTSP